MNTIYILSAGSVTPLGFDLAATTIAMEAKLDNFQDSQFVDGENEKIASASIHSEYIGTDCPQHGIAKLRVMLGKAIHQSLLELHNNVPDTLMQKTYVSGTATRLSVGDHTLSEDEHNSAATLSKKEAFFAKFRWVVIFILSPEHASQSLFLEKMLMDMPVLKKATTYSFSIGSAGTGLAMEQAQGLLDNDLADMVMIAAVDTWLEPSIINQGLKQNRILSSDNDIGCIPAEAAAVIILSNKQFEHTTNFEIQGVGIGIEPVVLADIEKPTMGKGLKDAFKQSLAAAQCRMRDINVRVSDVTGEEYFFEESILSYDAVLRKMPEEYELLITSSYLGDIKAVSGVFALGYLWQLARMNKFNDKKAIIQLSSPTSDKRSAIVVYADKINEKTNTQFISDTLVLDVVQQHVEEVSLYWLRRADTLWSANSYFYDVCRFDTLMQAHLEGIIIAGTQGFEMCCAQFEQWETVDEAFVTFYSLLNMISTDNEDAVDLKIELENKLNKIRLTKLEIPLDKKNDQADDKESTSADIDSEATVTFVSLDDLMKISEETQENESGASSDNDQQSLLTESENVTAQTFIIDAVIEDSKLIAGVAAAVAMIDKEKTQKIIEQLWQSGNANLQQSVLPAMFKYNDDNKELIINALEHTNTCIRERVLQLIGDYSLTELTNNLVVSAKYDEESCRYLAAISLALLNDNTYINNYTVDDTLTFNMSFKQFMIWCYSVSEQVFFEWLQQAKIQKNKRWLLIWSIFFRSDSNHLSILVDMLQEDNIQEYAKVCCYAIAHLTGLDIEGLELWIQDDDVLMSDDDGELDIENESEIMENHWTHPHHVELMQLGLLYPDIYKVITHIQNSNYQHTAERVINGKPISTLTETEAFECSMPQLWLYALYQKQQGNNNVMNRLMAYDLC